MKLIKCLLITIVIFLLNSNVFSIDIGHCVSFSKENVQVSFCKKQNQIQLFGLNLLLGGHFALQIDIPLENNLIEKDKLGHSLIDFFNINPKEIKVQLAQKIDCRSEEVEEFSIQPEIDFIESQDFLTLFKFHHNNKSYLVRISSIKAKPTLSELECYILVVNNRIKHE